MRATGYDHIYGYLARLHDLGGIKFRNPARYTTIGTVAGTFLVSFVPMYTATALIQLALTAGNWDLYTLGYIAVSSFLYVILFVLAFTGVASFWLLRQVKRDGGVRGTVELMRRDWQERRAQRRTPVDRPVRLDGSHIRRAP